jgi:hypothetical protein
LVERLEQDGNFQNAELALRELILKHKSVLTYNDELIKKQYVLEASNIEEISKLATSKIKEINNLSDKVLKRLVLLENKLKKVHVKVKEILLKEEKEKERNFLLEKEQEFKELFEKKEYESIIELTKKLTLDFPGNKKLISFLEATRKRVGKIKNHRTFLEIIKDTFKLN